MNIEVLFEDENIIAVVKPEGVPVQEDKTGDIDLITIIKKEFNIKNIFLVHRLDRPVGGVMVFAKNEMYAKILSDSISKREFEKKYYCVVSGLAKENDFLEDYLVRNQRLNISKVVSKNTTGSKVAKLSYERINFFEDADKNFLSLLEVNLQTGRHHQIRVQLSNAGIPIYGDTKYNKLFQKTKTFVTIALWSYFISFYYPPIKKELAISKLPFDRHIFKSFE